MEENDQHSYLKMFPGVWKLCLKQSSTTLRLTKTIITGAWPAKKTKNKKLSQEQLSKVQTVHSLPGGSKFVSFIGRLGKKGFAFHPFQGGKITFQIYLSGMGWKNGIEVSKNLFLSQKNSLKSFWSLRHTSPVMKTS